MELRLPKPGRYIVAVSGGVDSICLLDILASKTNSEIIVAHFDHGIREDSKADCLFVADRAQAYGLKFVSERQELGANASEALSRAARYDFLFRSQKQTKAKAIITAHHQDDRLESLVINLVRGTGRVGLSPINETEYIKRPLLKVPKAELLDYAKSNNLSWREDATNNDTHYLRNHIRKQVMPRLSSKERSQLIKLMNSQSQINKSIDRLVGQLLPSDNPDRLDKQTLNSLSFMESQELIASWLRLNNLLNFDRKTIERLTLAAKTKHPGAIIDVYNQAKVHIGKKFLALDLAER